jgi:hypothetical protein
MTRIARDVLSASSFDVFNERLFFIANKIYESHKFYHSAIIRTKMMSRDVTTHNTEDCGSRVLMIERSQR